MLADMLLESPRRRGGAFLARKGQIEALTSAAVKADI
jgi:hypothetical protein